MIRVPRCIYLAGPEVFLPNAVDVGERKKELCAKYGFVGLYPLDNELALEGVSPKEAGLRIYAANRDAMHTADLGIANLTPFRGPSADSGTVFEVGFLTALGKPVYGYTQESGHYAQRCAARGLVHRRRDDAAFDAHGMLIEDFSLEDNLMIVGGVLEHGDMVVDRTEPENYFVDLRAFEACLRAIERRIT